MTTSVPDAKLARTAGKSRLYDKKSHLVKNIYKMDHRDRGYAVIINNKEFQKLDERKGTDVDRDEMKKLLISMGFQEDHIIVKDNCAADEMEETMKEAAANYQDEEYDCFVAVILSHGTHDGNIVGEGLEDEICVGQLTEPFRGEKCKPLAGKPKIFFFQMCRGGKTDVGATMTQHDAEEDECLELQVPSEADFLLAFSAVPGYLSWRNEVKGSWFIQTLVEVFKRDEQWKREDLLSMLTEVNKVIAFDYGNEKLKQMPCFNSMLTRKVIFSDKAKVLGK